MSVSITSKLVTTSTNSGDTTTSSVVVTAGNLILVVFAPTRNSIGTSSWLDGMSVSDSNSRSWTRIVGACNYNNAVNWDVAIAAFVAVSNGSPGTITVHSGVTNYSTCVSVSEVSGSSGSVSGAVVATSELGDGPFSQTLSDAPTDDDLTIAARFFSAGGAAYTPPSATMETGWDYINEAEDMPGYLGSLILFARSSSTSATVSYTDTWTQVSFIYGGAAVGVNLKAVTLSRRSAFSVKCLVRCLR
jgi:hypothetical protein